MTFRFIGTEADIGGIALKRFGQTFELPEGELSAVFGDRGALALPEAEFDSIGFTDDELKRFAHPAAQNSGMPGATEFREKKADAVARLMALRADRKGDR